jgi:NRPS condensation-like uncharacterized protein
MPKSFRLTAWDCLQILTNKFSDQQVRTVVEFDGRLDESRLAEAVRAVVAAEPILACRVQDSFFRPRWKPVSRFDAETLLRIIPAVDVKEEINKLLVEDLDPWRGPIVRIGLVRGERDALVVNLDHTAGDAASVRSLTYLLATLYSHPRRIPAAERGAYFVKRGFRSLQPLVPQSAKKKGRLMLPPAAEPSWRFPWRQGTTEFRKRLLVRRLAPPKAEAVRAWRRRRPFAPSPIGSPFGSSKAGSRGERSP